MFVDEDHVSQQYLEKKENIKELRINTVMPKLVYGHEDVDFDGSKHKLANNRFFGGDYVGAMVTEEF